ncbi:DHS-like NAD/FAD-binding domain-containing protein [Syncephalastrum racemosum]|uniref:NAD-dependent protein deacetylase n=1 Tax=Syncephalastrum racemosum TaxID=13706 RepID=A0A1X2HCG0_SYNRA|nr:DHS-like NAD/FAD-binding domain-containing protein [Syncephalastrum racemosum]
MPLKKTGLFTEKKLDSIANHIKSGKAKKILVLTGAGISTAAGIPDFRSKHTGLYDNLQKFNLPYPEAIFDIDFFEETPEPFYTLAKEIYPGRYFPTKTHYFIKLLHDKGLLLRNFTQNIDTLERLTGLDEDRIIEAHGSFATASCIECHAIADTLELKRKVLQAKVARCVKCKKGLIKPDIVFFGENLPKRFFDELDVFDEADLMIVIGTSLQVQPFASLIDRVDDHVPRLLINKEVAGVYNSAKSGFDFRWKYGKNRDICHLGDCDMGVERLADLLGWREELDQLAEKTNKKLKALWEAEAVELEIKPPADSAVDALAEELERRLHVPETKSDQEDDYEDNCSSCSKSDKEDNKEDKENNKNDEKKPRRSPRGHKTTDKKDPKI